MMKFKKFLCMFLAVLMILISCFASFASYAEESGEEYLAEEVVTEPVTEAPIVEETPAETYAPVEETAPVYEETAPEEITSTYEETAPETAAETAPAATEAAAAPEENTTQEEQAQDPTTAPAADPLQPAADTTTPQTEPQQETTPEATTSHEAEETTTEAAPAAETTSAAETQTEETTASGLTWQTLAVVPKDEVIDDIDHPSALWYWIGRSWNRHFYRTVGAEKKAAETRIEISGMLPENASATANVIELLEDDTYNTMGLYAYVITIYDAQGKEFVPAEDQPVTIRIRTGEITQALQEGRTIWVYTYTNNTTEGQWEYGSVTEWDNVHFETKMNPLYLFVCSYDEFFVRSEEIVTEETTTAEETTAEEETTADPEIIYQTNPEEETTAEEETEETEPEGPVIEDDKIIYADDNIYLTGSMPADGIVEATPVDVQIDGQVVLAAYDIAIYADEEQKEEGITWQPEEDTVQIHIVDPELSRINNDEVSVFGMENVDAEAELSDTAQIEEEEVVVDAGESSIVVITQLFLEKAINIDGTSFKITVAYDTTAGIPEGAELAVSEITEDSEEYYLAQTADILGWEENDSLFYAKVLDIRIMYEGEEIQPKTPVLVWVELLDIKDSEVTAAEATQALEVVHFHEEEDYTEAQSLESKAYAIGTSCDVAFETEGFSTFVIAGVFRNLLSWETDLVEVSVQTLNKNLSLEMESIEAEEEILVKGQELLESYLISQEDGSALNTGSVRANVTLDENVSLDELESVNVYSVKDGALEEIISDDMEPGTEVTVSLNGIDGFALVKDTGLRERTLVAEPELGQSVVLEGMVPEEAELQAVVVEGIPVADETGIENVENEDVESTDAVADVEESVINAEEFPIDVEESVVDTEDIEKMVAEENSAEEIQDPEISERIILCAYDISIINDIREFQPKDGETIAVEITNDAIGEAVAAGSDLSVWHIADDGNREEISEFTIDGNTVKFNAMSFSVYEIVETTFSPYEGSGWLAAASLDKIAELGEQGFYISHDGYYLTATVTHNVSGNSDRDGLQGTVDQYDDPNNELVNIAAKYYFTRAEGTTDQFYIYVIQDNQKQYVQMYRITQGQNTNSRAGLTLVANSEDGTLFTLERYQNKNQFYIKVNIEGTVFYWNRNTKTQGFGAFAGYNSQTDGNTAKIEFHYYNDLQNDPYDLDGKTYGFMNYQNGTSAFALMAEPLNNNTRLASKSMLVRNDPMDQSHMLYVAKDSDISMWTFHSYSEDQYYLVTGNQYLRIEGNNVTLTNTPDDYCKIQVIPGSDTRAGKVRLLGVKAQRAISFDSSGKRFGSGNSGGNGEWQNFVDLSVYEESDFVQYSAYKVSVSDQVNVTNGKQIIIYTRVWDEENTGYHFYAIDHNGDLVPCYESGDAIVWIGAQNNTLLWEFTEYYNPGTTTSNNYYELQNVYTEKYIAPQLVGGQIFSNNTIGINLDGRYYGDYYTTILAWDDSHYDYAGLKTENGKIVSCPMAKAEDFYFAVVEEPTPGELTKVATVDHRSLGLTMKMVNFGAPYVSGSGSNSPTTQQQLDVMGTQYYSVGAAQTELLSTNLEGGASGYPVVASTGRSLSELFYGAPEVNKLFIQSVYDGSGYYQFDSTENFAHLNGADFDVYQELGTVKGTAETRKHGQFMPYNTLDSSKAHDENPYNMTDIYGNTLPDDYPRKKETLYGFNEEEDHYFGMEIEGHFMQTPNGLDAWGHDIIFEFVGDDDFWLYVDGELVIDLGGIHKALGGTVNYSTGEVVVNGTPTTLYELFKNNYAGRNHLSKDDPAVTEYLNKIFREKTVGDSKYYVFKDYSTHTVRIFYMERGAGASNLRMRFNLTTVNSGQVLLTKEITGTEKQDYASVRFPFQIYYQLDDGMGDRLLQSTGDNVVYQNTSIPVEYESSIEIDKVTYANVFYLKPGQTAAINMPTGTISYYIKECGVNSEIYDSVKINGVETDPVEPRPNTNCYQAQPATIEERAKVTFSNHVDEDALRTLTITKRLFDANGNELTAEEDPTGFNYRIYLGKELAYYRKGDYHVKDPNGYYCYFDEANDRFAPTAAQSLKDLTPEQLIRVTFQTSPSGAVSKIPAGYTVEIRDLLVDTEFKVVEEEFETPVGYGKRIWTEGDKTYNGYKRLNGSYYIIDPDNPENVGIIRDNNDPMIEVHNQRGWGIRADKVWSDKDFMLSHEDTYFAVYVDNTLLPGSVHKIDSYGYTIWYFSALQPGKQLSDYQVREVKLTNPGTGEDGTIIYDNITPIDPGNTIKLNGFDYIVSYARGEESGSASGLTNNIRMDTVTNTRVGGLRIVKTDMNGNGLPGARFELKQNDEVIGTYTSANDGLVSTVYLVDGTYTLEEKKSPTKYQTLATSYTIIVNQGGFIITGDSASGYDYDETTQTLTIKNKPFTLTVKKTDASGNEMLSGAHFALYKQISTSDGGVRKDYYPMEGYEDIVTGADGIVGGVNEDLKAGTYYLTETQAPEGYQLPSPVKEVCFTISNTGKVTLLYGDGYTGSVTESGTDKIDYVIRIPNVPNTAVLAVTKTVTGDLGDITEDFPFTVSGLKAGQAYDYTRFTSENGETWTAETGLNATGTLLANSDGEITFTLRHHQKIELVLPGNTTVTVSENNGRYKASYTIDDGESVSGHQVEIEMEGNKTAAFTNRLDAVSPTDYKATTTPFLWMLLAGLAFLAGIGFPVLLRKKKENDE